MTNNIPRIVRQFEKLDLPTSNARKEMLSDAKQECPVDTSKLRNNHYIDSNGNIVADTPYAAKQYYEHKTKSYWIERALTPNLDKYSRLIIQEIDKP